MSTYSKIREVLIEIPGRTEANRKRLLHVRTQLQAAVDDITRMETEYGPTIQYLNQQAAANPGDALLQEALAEKNRLAADFQSLKNLLTSHLAAYDAV